MRLRTTCAAPFCLAVSLGACGPPDSGASSDRLAATAAEVPFVQRTLTYKTVGDETLAADVYRADDEVSRPVVLWLHGGTLILGDRTAVHEDVLTLCRVAGFVFVSIDYRLAPNVELAAIIQDVEDAVAWIRAEGPTLFRADPDRLVVAGSSAGGYLTMASGFRVDPPPSALVSRAGYGSFDLYDPSEFYRTNFPIFAEEQAFREGGQALRLYLRQTGLWTEVVTGFDPVTEADRIAECVPIQNITAEYPPILMVHGTNDTDVPYTESSRMADELARQDVAHELILLPESNHGLRGGDSAVEAEAQHRVLAFIQHHLTGEDSAADIEPLLAALQTKEAAVRHVIAGAFAEAQTAYARSVALEPRLPEDASIWNLLCWRGSLWGQAAEVLSSCDQAVDLVDLTEGSSYGILDSRALARALAGDIEGAINDLEAVLVLVASYSDTQWYDRWRGQRQSWLDALRAGENPFTTEVLESLRG